MLLENKVAIVAGGARGMGGAIALKFADNGCSCVIADVLDDAANKTVEEIKKKGKDAIYIHCDVSDGKQVRDVLYVNDLVRAFDSFLQSKGNSNVFNMGGGPNNTISLLELLDLIENLTGKRSKVSYSGWRPSDQKVYISDISKAERILGWKPQTSTEQGVKKLVDWVAVNRSLF